MTARIEGSSEDVDEERRTPMSYFASLGAVPSTFGPSAVTFGKFDGVHLGHRAVIAELLSIAAAAGLTPTVLTFDRNPLALLDPSRCPESIASARQKRELLAAAGVQAVLEVPFDRAFSNLTARQFVEQVIVGALHAGVVLVGPEPRFGSGGRGHLDTLVDLGAQHGFEVRSVTSATVESARISSTGIRAHIADGRVAEAAELLGRPPSVRGVVVHGQKRGRELGYPTANLSPELEGMIPADGVYAGYLTVTSADTSGVSRPGARDASTSAAASAASAAVGGSAGGVAAGVAAGSSDSAGRVTPGGGAGGSSDSAGRVTPGGGAGGVAAVGERMPAAISVGDNPTFAGVPARQVEAYVVDRDLDLYGAEVVIEFVERVRGMLRFDSLDELIERMGEDTERVRRITS